MAEEKTAEKELEKERGISSPKQNNNSADMEAILRQLKENQEINKKILKAISFIRRHYFWRAILNVLKVVALVVIIVLGIVSWNSIVEQLTSTGNSYFSQQIFNSLNSNDSN